MKRGTVGNRMFIAGKYYRKCLELHRSENVFELREIKESRYQNTRLRAQGSLDIASIKIILSSPKYVMIQESPALFLFFFFFSLT